MEKKKILAIDDNAINLAAIEQALQEEYEVIPMINSRRAIKFLAAQRPDLILLDVQMPDMDGPKTLEEIRRLEYGPAIPVIFLTALSDQEAAKEASSAGVFDYITKPFDENDLKTRIAHALENTAE